MGKIEKSAATAPVFLAHFTASRRDDYLKLAAQLRATGLGVEFYPEANKLGAPLKFADRKGFKVAVIIGDDEQKPSPNACVGKREEWICRNVYADMFHTGNRSATAERCTYCHLQRHLFVWRP